jgi:hypothetical protein
MCIWNQIVICGIVDFFTEALAYQWYLKLGVIEESGQLMF